LCNLPGHLPWWLAVLCTYFLLFSLNSFTNRLLTVELVHAYGSIIL
jgi:hypothetical protein